MKYHTVPITTLLNPEYMYIYICIYIYIYIYFLKCSHGYSVYPHDIPRHITLFSSILGPAFGETRNRQVHEMTFPDGAAPPEELGELGEAGGCWEGDEFGPWFQE